MTSDLGPAGVWIAIIAMALVTYAVRAGGFLLMGYIPLTKRVRAFLQALPGAVVVAIILPIAVHGGAAAAAAVVVALVVMAWRRNDRRRRLRRRRRGGDTGDLSTERRDALPNRVSPFGELFATPARGTLMGNRGGRIHTDDRKLTRQRWTSRHWICCVLEFKNRQRDVWGRYYTELFFLDEVSAFAAGHRPCFECRRRDAEHFARLFAGSETRATADAMDDVLHAERLDGRDKRVHRAAVDTLPDGAMIVLDGEPFALRGASLLHWTPQGYDEVRPRPRGIDVDLLTPPSIVAVLARGYAPKWHPSAGTLT